jgi:hypothetical protein
MLLFSVLANLQAEGACPYDIKQKSEVYAESKKMVPHVLSQLQAARNQLFALLQAYDCQATGFDRKTLEDAWAQVEKANSALDDNPCVTRAGSDEASSFDSDGTEY